VNGGYPPLGDAPVFQRVFTLLRHLLQQPFDREAGTALPEHLIRQIEVIPGAYLPGEAATLRKDLEKLLTPYGFRSRNDNVRHGYAIGTALLSAHRLREIHGVVSQAAGRLADPTAQDLLTELEQRLHWGGIAVDTSTPVRAFANRSIVSSALVRPDSLAAERQAELLETAIVERRRVELERYASVASFPDSPTGSFRAWPLQLLFHNIGWYLVYETDNVGREEGLIRTERLDRLALRHSERATAAAMTHQRRLGSAGCAAASVRRHLLRGQPGDPAAALQPHRQAAVQGNANTALLLPELELRLHPRGPTALPDRAHPLQQAPAGDTWWHHPKAPHVLEPGSPTDTHPYPVELDLPIWTVERDVDLRNWLFGFGAGIRLEAPTALAAEHRRWLQGGLSIYASSEEGTLQA
jgi:hypothetical protein